MKRLSVFAVAVLAAVAWMSLAPSAGIARAGDEKDREVTREKKREGDGKGDKGVSAEGKKDRGRNKDGGDTGQKVSAEQAAEQGGGGPPWAEAELDEARRIVAEINDIAAVLDREGMKGQARRLRALARRIIARAERAEKWRARREEGDEGGAEDEGDRGEESMEDEARDEREEGED
jgi:hypothetical protein